MPKQWDPLCITHKSLPLDKVIFPMHSSFWSAFKPMRKLWTEQIHLTLGVFFQGGNGWKRILVQSVLCVRKNCSKNGNSTCLKTTKWKSFIRYMNKYFLRSTTNFKCLLYWHSRLLYCRYMSSHMYHSFLLVISM